MSKVQSLLLLAAGTLASSALSGCYPYSMGVFTPVPVPPWVTERMEEKYGNKNDFRTPIMPPIRPGFPPPLCEDPPDESSILRTMQRVCRGVPYFGEEFRDDVSIVTERLVDKIDPPRFFPLWGMAQLHHCHWKCTIYFTETLESGYPFPFRVKRPRVEVVYMDRDHVHLYPGQNQDAQRSFTQDLVGH